jgi:hypothetical protein
MTYHIRHFLSIAMCAAVLLFAPCCSLAQASSSAGDANRETGGEAAPEAPAASLPAAPTPTAATGTAPYSKMTEGERFHYYVNHMFSAESVLRSAVGSGIEQAIDSPHEWGLGAEGYGRRFANSYAQHIMQSTLMYGSSVALHEDNRYFRSGESGFLLRLKYAVTSSFLARRDDGTRCLSFSRIGSIAATAFISREWQPPSANGPGHAVSAMGNAIGVDVGFNVAREFFPKIFHTPGPVRP